MTSSEMGKKGGSRKTAAKRTASIANGRKGGRPRKAETDIKTLVAIDLQGEKKRIFAFPSREKAREFIEDLKLKYTEFSYMIADERE